MPRICGGIHFLLAEKSGPKKNGLFRGFVGDDILPNYILAVYVERFLRGSIGDAYHLFLSESPKAQKHLEERIVKSKVGKSWRVVWVVLNHHSISPSRQFNWYEYEFDIYLDQNKAGTCRCLKPYITDGEGRHPFFGTIWYPDLKVLVFVVWLLYPYHPCMVYLPTFGWF